MTQQPEERPEAAAQSPADTPAAERGDNPMVVEGPTFELEGHTYTMRRLNYLDHSRFAGIIQAAVVHGKINVVAVANRADPNEQMETMMQLLLGALTYAPTELFGFLASVVGVQRQELFDPERFPFASFPEVVLKLREHPDLSDFFARVGRLIGGESIPTPASNGPPISSPDEAGPTSAS